MKTCPTAKLVWLGAFIVCLSPLGAADAPRYAGMYEDGARVADDGLHDWFNPDGRPRLGNRKLFDDNHPARWIVDRSQPPDGRPRSRVEWFGGDCLAGNVIEFRDGTANPYETQPAHLVVEPASQLHPPGSAAPSPVRAITAWSKRVVWEPTGLVEYRPATVFLRNGGEISYRSVRWGRESVTVLTEDGILQFGFGEIGELHLPRLDEWDAYYRQLAVLTPRCDARLFQIETTAGDRATFSTERFQSQHRGDRNRRDSWFQMGQPAWSLDPLWFRFRTVRTWRFFDPHEPPLSLFEPIKVRQESTFGGGWRWRANRSAVQGTLKSGGLDFGWGLGVHATHELVFAYPEEALAFETAGGLDDGVGPGGCVQAAVRSGRSADRQLFQTEVLVGSTAVVETGKLKLIADSPDDRRLSLLVDAQPEGRPEGADPFDVRDMFNWLAPVLHLDRERLRDAVARRALGGAFADGWMLHDADQSLKVENVWDHTDTKRPRYRQHLSTEKRFLTLSRRLTFPAGRRWLAVVVSRFPGTTAGWMQVRIDGRARGEFEVPQRQGPVDPDPLLVRLEPPPRRTVDLDVVFVPRDERSWFEMRAAATSAHRPGLLPIFTDDETFPEQLRDGDGEIALSRSAPYAGSACLRVAAGRRGAARLPGLDAAVREQPKLGEYRFLVFAWKKLAGDSAGLQLAESGRFVGLDPLDGIRALRGPGRPQLDDRGLRRGYAYVAGPQGPRDRQPLQLNPRLPEEWSLQQRDLYGDFGNFDLTGLSCESLDEAPAWFDSFYLARTPQDRDRARKLAGPASETEGDPNVVRQADDPAAFGAVLSRVAPQFSTADSGPVQWLRTHAGRDDVVRTHPPEKGEPCILRAPVEVARDKKTFLQLAAAPAADSDWRLRVVAEGETLHDSVVNNETTKDGWLDLEVDLTRFAGRQIVLEVHNQPHHWDDESAYWQRLMIEERP